MTQNNNSEPTIAPAVRETPQPMLVQPQKGDAAKVEIIDKK